MRPLTTLLLTTTATTILASPTTTTPTPAPLLTNRNWAYIGCVTSSGAPERILIGFTVSEPAATSIEGCLDACGEAFAALANGYFSLFYFTLLPSSIIPLPSNFSIAQANKQENRIAP